MFDKPSDKGAILQNDPPNTPNHRPPVTTPSLPSLLPPATPPSLPGGSKVSCYSSDSRCDLPHLLTSSFQAVEDYAAEYQGDTNPKEMPNFSPPSPPPATPPFPSHSLAPQLHSNWSERPRGGSRTKRFDPLSPLRSNSDIQGRGILGEGPERVQVSGNQPESPTPSC